MGGRRADGADRQDRRGTRARGRVATDETYSLAAELLATRSGRQCYLLRVIAHSMVGARMEDGALPVMEEDEVPPDEAVVVALLREAEGVT